MGPVLERQCRAFLIRDISLHRLHHSVSCSVPTGPAQPCTVCPYPASPPPQRLSLTGVALCELPARTLAPCNDAHPGRWPPSGVLYQWTPSGGWQLYANGEWLGYTQAVDSS